MPVPYPVSTPAHRYRRRPAPRPEKMPRNACPRRTGNDPATPSAGVSEVVRPWHYAVALIVLLVTGLEAGG